MKLLLSIFVVAIACFSSAQEFGDNLYATLKSSSLHHKLTNEKGNSLESETRIFYNAEGLVTEVQFYDEQNDLLEKDLFTYK